MQRSLFTLRFTFALVLSVATAALLAHSFWRLYRFDFWVNGSIETASVMVERGSLRLWWTPAGGWTPSRKMSFSIERTGLTTEDEIGMLGFYYGRPKRYPYS